MSRRSAVRALSVLTLVLIAVAAAACSSASGSSAPVQTDEVTMAKSYRFSPETIQVTAGTTVTWTNKDNFSHSVKLRDGNAPDRIIKPGESTSITFAQPGTYAYECSLHPQNMRGTVIVTAAPSPGS